MSWGWRMIVNSLQHSQKIGYISLQGHIHQFTHVRIWKLQFPRTYPCYFFWRNVDSMVAGLWNFHSLKFSYNCNIYFFRRL